MWGLALPSPDRSLKIRPIFRRPPCRLANRDEIFGLTTSFSFARTELCNLTILWLFFCHSSFMNGNRFIFFCAHSTCTKKKSVQIFMTLTRSCYFEHKNLSGENMFSFQPKHIKRFIANNPTANDTRWWQSRRKSGSGSQFSALIKISFQMRDAFYLSFIAIASPA